MSRKSRKKRMSVPRTPGTRATPGMPGTGIPAGTALGGEKKRATEREELLRDDSSPPATCFA